MTRLTILTAALWAMPAAVTAQRPPEWRLSARPILQIGEVEGEPEYQLFKAVSSLRLDDGRLVVLNASSNQVRIYDQEGKFVRAIGRKGAGPSEFSIPVRLYRVGRDTLQVFDRGNQRFTFFRSDGTHLRNEDFRASTARFLYDEWLYNRSWIDGPALGKGRGPVRGAIDRLAPPDAATGYRYIKVSPQGHLWVRQPLQPRAPVSWIVYDTNARAIGRVVTPARFEIHEIGRNYVLGRGLDDMDVEYLQLYALQGAERVPIRNLTSADSVAPSQRQIPEPTLVTMRGALRALMSQQEIFYSTPKNGYRYASDVKLLGEWKAPDAFSIHIVNASNLGWTAVMIDQKTGAMCGVTTGIFVPVGWTPGVVTCE